MAGILGYVSVGGSTRKQVVDSLTRLRSVTLHSAARFPGGSDNVLIWGLVDRARIRQPRTGPGRGWAMLSEEVAHLLRQGSVTYLHGPTWDAIAAQDEIAARLWSFLEAEQLAGGFRYQLFAAPLDGIVEERNMPAITELLRVNWVVRRNAAARVKRACAVIARIDSRYRLAVVPGKGKGMWRLEARRVSTPPREPRPSDSLRGDVLAAWRDALDGRLPSKKQGLVVEELVGRRGEAWVVATLRVGGSDPFARMLAADRRQRASDLAETVARERAWEEEKSGYRTTGRPGQGEVSRAVGLEGVGSILRGFGWAPGEARGGP